MQRSSSFQWGTQDGCASPGSPTSCPVGTIAYSTLCSSEYVPAGACVIIWPGTSPCGTPGDSCGCSHWWYYTSDFVVVGAFSPSPTSTPSPSPTRTPNFVVNGGNCGGPSGALSAPGEWKSHMGAGVSNYGNSWVCSASTFVAPAGSVITFTLTYASAETCCDRVNVYDGASSSAWLFTLTAVGDRVVSTSNYLTVAFSSDSSVVGLGFMASVSFDTTSLPAPSPTRTPTPTPTRTRTPSPTPTRTPYVDTSNVVVNGGRCGGPSGTLSAPGVWKSHTGAGASTYGNSWACTPSTFVAPAGSIITLTITYASAESCCDRVNVYDGASSSSPRSTLTAVGDRVVSTSNFLTVAFSSDSSVVDLGYVASVTFSSGGGPPSTTPSRSRTLTATPTPLPFTATATVVFEFEGADSTDMSAAALRALAAHVAGLLGLATSDVSAAVVAARRARALQAVVRVRVTASARALAASPAFAAAGGGTAGIAARMEAELLQVVGGTAWCAGAAGVPASQCRAPRSVAAAAISAPAAAAASVGAAVGGAVGGVLLLTCIIAGCCIMKRNRARAAAAHHSLFAPSLPAAYTTPVVATAPPPAPYAGPYGALPPYGTPSYGAPPPFYAPPYYGAPPGYGYPAAAYAAPGAAAGAPYGKPAGLALRRMESSDSGALSSGDPRPVDVDHEAEAVVLFGAWPGACAVCGDALVARARVRIDAAGAALCRGCAVSVLRANPVAPYDGATVVHPDAVAALCEGSAHAPPGAPALAAAEVRRIRDEIAADAHAHPARWHLAKCPVCAFRLQVPAPLHARGGPVVCHECTHRVCTRCDAAYSAAVVPPEPGRPPQTHEGVSCEAVARLRAEGAGLSAQQMRGLGVKACPFCGTLASHFRGHACHHIMPGGGCPGCKQEYCFASLLPMQQCRDQGHMGHALFCDWRCDCADCTFCKVGQPCAQVRAAADHTHTHSAPACFPAP